MDEPTCSVIEDGKRCGKPLRRRRGGICEMHYTRWLRHGDFETHHPATKPNSEVNYFTLHQRLRKARGHASGYPCARCGKPAVQWAQLHGEDPCDFGSYIPMCHSCHRKYDTYPETREKCRKVGYWTPERRAEHSRRMAEWWADRKREAS